MHMDFLGELESVQENLVRKLKELDRLRENANSLSEKVSIGHVLWTLVSEANHQLAVIKEYVRNEVPGTGRPGTAKIPGVCAEQYATLTFSPSQYKLRNETKIEELKSILGNDFDRFFQTTYTPRRKLEREFQVATPEQKRILLQALDQRHEKARVSFRD